MIKRIINGTQLGFSLVELTVVLAIFGIVTVTILSNSPEFRDKTSLDLVAQSVALNIRGAQVYGIGTKVVEGAQSFGIHFNTNETRDFLLFADIDVKDKAYSAVEFNCGATECVEMYNLRGAQLSKIKIDGVRKSGLLDIVYTRPQSEAQFCWRSDYGELCDHNISDVEITLESLKGGKFRYITISKNGQIQVSSSPAI